MPTDEQLEQQLADYFGWLENHLGTQLRPAPIGAAPRRRWLAFVSAAAVAAAAIAGVVAIRHDSTGRVRPTESSPTTAAPLTTASTAPSSTTPTSTGPSTTVSGTIDASDLTWAPLDLPPTMELVDSSTILDFGLTFTDVSTQSQRFIRFADDGVMIEAQLSVEVRTAQGGEVEAWIPNGEVHGLPAITTTPSLTDSSAWWVEDGVVVTVNAGRIGLDELIPLLDAAQLRADGARGLEPSSVGSGLTVLYDADLTLPRVHHTYVVRDMARDTFVHVHVATPPIGHLFTGARRTPAGLLFETDTYYGWVLVGTDGTVVSFGGVWDTPTTPMGADSAVALASGMQLATAEKLASMRADIRARLRELPLVGTVTFDTRTIELRGGTAAEPEALCMPGADGLACEFNDIRRDDSPIAAVSWRPLPVDDGWYIVGVGLGAFFSVDDQTEVEHPMHACSANADGSLIALLPDERTSAYEQEYFLVAVPADIGYVRVCIDVGGELRPNSTGVTVRPAR